MIFAYGPWPFYQGSELYHLIYSCGGLSTGPGFEDNIVSHLFDVLTYPRCHLLIEVINDVTQLWADMQEYEHYDTHNVVWWIVW